MTRHNIHPAQVTILRKLLFTPGERFTHLQAACGLTSAHLTFHIDSLIKSGLIEQRQNTYTLTAKGKEYANRLAKDDQPIGMQPKMSVLLQAERHNQGQREFLIQQRLKHPHYGFYGRISGKVCLGEPLADTAQRILYEEAGLTARFSFVALLRKYDYEEKTATLLEDKIFAVMKATELQGELTQEWAGGRNMWLTAETFLKLDPAVCFKSARDFMSSPDKSTLYHEESNIYLDNQY